jgi:hypothetical protein
VAVTLLHLLPNSPRPLTLHPAPRGDTRGALKHRENHATFKGKVGMPSISLAVCLYEWYEFRSAWPLGLPKGAAAARRALSPHTPLTHQHTEQKKSKITYSTPQPHRLGLAEASPLMVALPPARRPAPTRHHALLLARLWCGSRGGDRRSSRSPARCWTWCCALRCISTGTPRRLSSPPPPRQAFSRPVPCALLRTRGGGGGGVRPCRINRGGIAFTAAACCPSPRC